MTTSRRSHRLFVAGMTSVAVGAAAFVTNGAQILLIDNGTLTSYLPTATTSEQDVRPLVAQRGVHADGALRAPSILPMALAGNPFGEMWDGNNSLNGVRLDTGTFQITDVDLSLPAPGFSWAVGRSYNCRQKDSGGSYYSSNGFQGYNWFQMSAPEIRVVSTGTSNRVVYLVYGADRFVEFREVSDPGHIGGGDNPTPEFRGINGAAGAIAYAASAGGEPDTYTFTDQAGTQFVFFGFDTNSGAAKGQLWKVMSPANAITSTNYVCFVGHQTTGSTAISSGFNGNGWPTVVYQALDASAMRRFTYDYTSGRLDSVTVAEKPSGGSYTNTGAKVEYTYYGSESFGDSGDLKLVTITTPMTDSGVLSVRNKYYRYYEGSYNGTTNPGYAHQLQYIYDFEGVRTFDWAEDASLSTTLTDLNGASENDLKPHASAYFTYDTERRITKAWFNGTCGCSGGSAGDHLFTYEDRAGKDDDAGYDTDEPWSLRTSIELPDDSFIWQYFDEVGQPTHRVMAGFDNPPGLSPVISRVLRNSDGQITEIGTPESVDTYIAPVLDCRTLPRRRQRLTVSDTPKRRMMKWEEYT